MPDYSKLTNCDRCGKSFNKTVAAHIISETKFFCENCEIPEEELDRLEAVNKLTRKYDSRDIWDRWEDYE